MLGRSLSRPLYAADGQLHLRLDPAVGGSERVIRARVGAAVHYASLDTGSAGLTNIGFARLGLGEPGDPVRVVFEALVPGSAGNLNARAELSAVAWVWPGLPGAEGSGDLLPAPANFVAARSAGLRRDGAVLITDVFVDPVDWLRDFDHAGGGDARAARLAATLERFARAAALRSMNAFLNRLALRHLRHALRPEVVGGVGEAELVLEALGKMRRAVGALVHDHDLLAPRRPPAEKLGHFGRERGLVDADVEEAHPP